MDTKETARRMYEDDGMNLSQIASKLGINGNTIKVWKYRENWIPRYETQIRGHNPKSLANLRKHQFRPSNKAAYKHGLYTDNSSQPGYYEFYDRALYNPIEETCRDLIAHTYACIVLSGKYEDYSDINECVIATQASSNLVSMVLRVGRLRGVLIDGAINSLLDGEFLDEVNYTVKESFAREYANLMSSHVDITDIKQVATMVRLAYKLTGKALKFVRSGLLKDIEIYSYMVA